MITIKMVAMVSDESGTTTQQAQVARAEGESVDVVAVGHRRRAQHAGLRIFCHHSLVLLLG